MALFKSKLTVYFFLFIIMALFVPSQLLAGDKRKAEEIWMCQDDVDTAYQIVKLLSVKNTGLREEAERENMDDLAKIASKQGADAVIYIDHTTSRNDPDALITNAVAVKYLTPEEVEKRNKKAEAPPVLKKESPLDPEPVLIKYKDVKFPYKIKGILEIHTGPAENNFSSQAMDFRLADNASRNGCDAVVFVEYVRVGKDVTAALGIMVKSHESWEKVESIKAKDVEIMKARIEKQKELEEQKAAEEAKETGQTDEAGN